jgi:hypothetical protein
MKKILLIAYSFPPLQDAQALRWQYITKYLAKLDYKIDVLTIKHPKENDVKVIDGITIHRVYSGFFENIAYRLKNKVNVDGKENEKSRQKFSFRVLKQGYWIIRKFYEWFLPGNITTEWYPFINYYIQKNINISEYNILITSHEPWIDSLIGLKIKEKYSNITWVADFGDPYVSIYTPKHKLWLENYLEKKIYKKTDLMILTNEHVKNFLLSKYDFLLEKETLILEQGFEQILENNKCLNKRYTILYTGTFYEDFRNPLELSKALYKLPFDFQFILVGRNEKFIHMFKGLKDKFVFKGFCSHTEVVKLQQDADILIHLSNKQIEQVPGKFYEYLGRNTPILVIYQNNKDQLINLTEELGCGISCKNRVQEIIKGIEYLKTEQVKRNDRLINVFSWENRAKLLNKRLRLFSE